MIHKTGRLFNINFLINKTIDEDPIISFLKDGTLPDDKAEAQILQHLATRFVLFGGLLYKKSYSGLHSDPHLRCLETGGTEERDVGDLGW